MRGLYVTLALVAISFLAAEADTICDLGAARDWCEHTMLHRVEGIWEYPDDQTRVLVCRSMAYENRYDIVVVDSPDTRLAPGETIGYMQASPVPTKFEMALFRSRQKGILADMAKCLAELTEKDNSIVVKGRKLQFSLAGRWFLPSFWRAVRVSLKDPLESLPRGMVRIYPEPSLRQPDYL